MLGAWIPQQEHKNLNELRGGLSTTSFMTKETKNLVAINETSLSQQFLPYDKTDLTAAPNLGYVAPEDRTTALTNNDRLPLVGKPMMRPLWTEDWVVEGNRKIRYETEFATPTSQLEQFQLFNPVYTRQPRASPYTVPIAYKTTTKGIAPSFEGHLRKL